jgi:uncharacterized protein
MQMIEIHKKTSIRPGSDLLFFDEIQFSNSALNALKYFCEDAPEYHVATAGSLLGVKLSAPKSFPVGKVDMMTLFPLTFYEFLDALGEGRLRTYVSDLRSLEPLPQVFHDQLVRLLKEYYFVGGMPEAVACFAEDHSPQRVREIQSTILKAYMQDFAKHTPASDIPKLSLIWDSLPLHLSRENKRFVFSALQKSARAREYEAALQWLHDAGLIITSYLAKTVEQPIKGFIDRSIFKVFSMDVGLLAAMARIPIEMFAEKQSLFTTYHGAFVENYIAQQLCSLQETGIYYWKGENAQAEVDFILDMPPDIFPLEVKAGVNPRSKSLASYDTRFKPKLLVRSTLLNLQHAGRILNIPLYAVLSIETFMKIALQKLN